MAIFRPSLDRQPDREPSAAVPPASNTPAFDLEAYVARSRAVDLSAIPWDEIPRHPLSTETIRTLRYMQDIESHTIIYLRSLLATRAIDDPDVATFLSCWLYEETFHGIALARFLEAAGHPVGPRFRPRGREPLSQRIEAVATAMVSKAWPDFCAVHMTWGAINELTTLTGYRRLVAVARHPVLTDLLERIIIDESRHFFLLSPGGDPVAAARGGADGALPRGSLLGARGQRRAAPGGAGLHGPISLQRRGGARGGSQGR